MKARRRRTARGCFAALLTGRSVANGLRLAAAETASRELLEALRAYGPKRLERLDDEDVRIWARKTLEPWEAGEIMRPSRAFYANAREMTRREISWIDHNLDKLAPFVEIRRSAALILFEKVSTYRYASQTDRVGYARRTAEMSASRLRTLGVDAVVERVGDVFEVRAHVEDMIDVEALKRYPPPSLREWVASCWQNGINPRVLNPFLPHGYEAKVGLDYQGRDVSARADT